MDPAGISVDADGLGIVVVTNRFGAGCCPCRIAAGAEVSGWPRHDPAVFWGLVTELRAWRQCGQMSERDDYGDYLAN